MNFNVLFTITLSCFISLTLFSQKKKVLLIGIDGLQFEQISKNRTPNFDEFTIKKGYNGGVFGTPSQQVTSSGPSWTTILTGVWVDKHKVTSNSSNQISNSKSVFNLVKTSNTKLKTASIATWKNINLLLYRDMYKVDFASQGGGDEYSTDLAINQIKKYASDFIFIHLDDIDIVGHSKGFGIEYNKSIIKVDNLLGELLSAVNEREKEKKEEWLVILVTDHGRDNKGEGHGNQTISEKTIFIGMNKKGNLFFENIQNNKEIKTIADLEKNAIPQTAIVPTILKYLNIPIKKEWKLDSKPLIN